MSSCPVSPYRQQCWRALTPKWAHQPLSGAGSAANGGRFNRPGTEALYLSEEPETAIAEYQQGMLRTPRVGMFAAYMVDMTNMADLTDPKTLAVLGITKNDLACPWKKLRDEAALVPTWDLADHLIADGVAGARIPSFAAPDGVNVVLWGWQSPTNKVTVSDPGGDLLKDPSSWT